MSRQEIAVVTGANRGIGRAIALGLANKGLHVVLAVRRPQGAAATVSAIGAAGGSAESIALDITDAESVRRMAEQLAASHRHIDVLVNNAGIMVGVGQRVFDTPVADFESALATNVFGAHRVTAALLPLLRASAAARVVNVSSTAGSISATIDPAEPTAGFPASPYRLSKAALNMLTVMQARDLRADGILVNAMCPGWVRTDMGGPDAPKSPEEAADTAIWLATLPNDGPTGGFFRDRRSIAW
jgi:NAD(P)-dependent dehydrogenase (short-subunit alcohol dehydrogenase family)